MRTYSDFWVRLELFYLLGKTKLKTKGENDDGDDANGRKETQSSAPAHQGEGFHET